MPKNRKTIESDAQDSEAGRAGGHVSEKTVRRAIAAGLLEVLRLGPGGRLIRIHPAQHDAYRRRIKW